MTTVDERTYQELVDEDLRHLVHPQWYAPDHQQPIIFDHGEGVWLTDVRGRRYIDALASLWNVAIGHGRAELADAAAEQMRKVAFTNNYTGFSNEPAIRLASRVIELAYDNMDGVFFTSDLVPGAPAQVTIVTNAPYAGFVLNAWMDFNKDGDFNDPGEQILLNIPVPVGNHTNTFTIQIPSYVFNDSIFPEAARLPVKARFRIGPTFDIGPAHNDIMGEVEDYKVFISQQADSGLRVLDDTFLYSEGVANQSFNVLANDFHIFNRSLSIVPGSIASVSPTTTPPLNH
jgi:hypothetical protein